MQLVRSYVRAVYNLFKNAPARRALYNQHSGSDVFPQKFCAIRWLENLGVAQRVITPNIKKFVEGVQKKKVEPTYKSYKIVSKLIKDPLIYAKLAFFKSPAYEVQPFLRKFQSDAPLVPFLQDALASTLKNAMERFVKPEMLKDVSTVKVVDVKLNSNVQPVQRPR